MELINESHLKNELDIDILEETQENNIFRIISWNVAGAKFLEEKNEIKRALIKRKVKNKLDHLIDTWKPDVINLQEIIQYQTPSDPEPIDFIETPKGYSYYSFPLIDTKRHAYASKWRKIEGNWPLDTFFAQGNGILSRKGLANLPIWSLAKSVEVAANKDKKENVEQVHIASGLYFGDRSTEPRSALVSHFIFNRKGDDEPQDVFVVNLHLTTLTDEREGIVTIDNEATNIRLKQLDLIFDGIVSRYNHWAKTGFLLRGTSPVINGEKETIHRHRPLWVLSGDFNFTPQSLEYKQVQNRNFIDAIPANHGTKAKGVNVDPTLTLDYIFAGPKFISLDPILTKKDMNINHVDHGVRCSDHYPLVAKIPMAFM
jgi:endonuclease/exonuclease/phosphatase family metal-dependent hydrolase